MYMQSNDKDPAAIKLQNVSRTFNKKVKEEKKFKYELKYLLRKRNNPFFAVNDISFEVKKGEFVGFIGSNGAGKTTTMKMLSGILHPTSGSINVLGYKPAERNYNFLHKISFVMGQKSQLQWDLPVYDTLILNKGLYDVTDIDFKNKLDELIYYLNIEELLQVQARKLSLGQRMKCELASSLIYSPEVLFLDEPTIGLDVTTQQNIREFLKKYNKEKKTTIILTSHYMDDIEELCSRVIMINKGKIIFDGDMNQLINSYVKDKHVTIEFTKEINESNLHSDVIYRNKNVITISIPKINHLQKISEIIRDFPVKDININEPDLKEIVKQIYSHEY